jgi:hypothetical protein
MSKRKKKSNKHIHWKITKAQHKKNFFKTIQFICSAAGAANVYKMIPERELESIYESRILTFKLIAAKGNEIPIEKIKDLNVIFPVLLKGYTIPIVEGGPVISLDKYFTVGVSFRFYLNKLNENSFHNALLVKQSLEKFFMNKAGHDEAFKGLNKVMSIFSIAESNLNSQVYWLSSDVTTKYNSAGGIQFLIEIHCYTPEQIHVKLDNILRPAVRVCWGIANYGIQYVSIKCRDLGIASSFAELPLDVYVQTHALLRLKERIDCLSPGIEQYNLFLSLKNIKAHKGSAGNYFIEYRLFETKAGYLLADIKDGVLIIRTFLFLTHIGTPEGQKLHEIFGLGKLDIKYLAIDKLSSFMTDEFSHNKELANIFEQAGCECLLKLYDEVGKLRTKPYEQSSVLLLTKYLGLDRKENLYESKEQL